MGIGALLPPGVAAVEQFGEPAEAAVHPGEEAAIAAAVPARRREFAAARACARAALAQVGRKPVAIGTGPNREPLWPPGVVGSITHCAGYRAGAVATDAVAVGIGIDAEPHAPLPPDVHGLVTLPAERAGLARLAAADPSVHWDRLLFSAKESIYKVWFPLTHRWLGFEEAEVRVDLAAGTFTADLLADDPPMAALTGRWTVVRGIVLTAVTLTR